MLQELKEFGFSMGDLIKVAKEIGVLSGLTEKDLEVATQTFFDADN